MPGKLQAYGKDYKTISIVVTPEEHRRCKVRAAELEISINEVVRHALADDRIWQRAAKAKRQ